MRNRRRLVSPDDGETLIELIMAVAIMGIAVVAIVGGIATSILMSDVHRKQATAGAHLRNYAEAIDTYVAAGHFDASTSPDYTASRVLNPSDWNTFTAPNTGFDPPVVSVLCWDDSLMQFPTPPKPKGCTTSSLVQQITVTVNSSDSRASESLVLVVRHP